MKQINQGRGRERWERGMRNEEKEKARGAVNETTKVLLGAKYLADDGKLF